MRLCHQCSYHLQTLPVSLRRLPPPAYIYIPTITVSFYHQGIISKYGLEVEKAGYFTGYDINIDPGVANSVATAALRFVASMMGSSIALRNGVS